MAKASRRQRNSRLISAKILRLTVASIRGPVCEEDHAVLLNRLVFT